MDDDDLIAIIGFVVIALIVVVLIGDASTGDYHYHNGYIEGKYDGWDDGGFWYEVEVGTDYGDYFGVSVNSNEYESFQVNQSVQVSQYTGGWIGIDWSTTVQ